MNLISELPDFNSTALDLNYERRLHFRWQFLNFFKKSEVFRLKECLIFRVPNNEGHFRLGVTLKARGSSIERNRVKRQVRENLRQIAELLGSFDYNVVIPMHKKLGYSYPQRLHYCLKNEFAALLRAKKDSAT